MERAANQNGKERSGDMKPFTIGYAQKSAKELFETPERNEVRKVLEVVHLGGGNAGTDCPDLF